MGSCYGEYVLSRPWSSFAHAHVFGGEAVILYAVPARHDVDSGCLLKFDGRRFCVSDSLLGLSCLVHEHGFDPYVNMFVLFETGIGILFSNKHVRSRVCCSEVPFSDEPMTLWTSELLNKAIKASLIKSSFPDHACLLFGMTFVTNLMSVTGSVPWEQFSYYDSSSCTFDYVSVLADGLACRARCRVATEWHGSFVADRVRQLLDLGYAVMLSVPVNVLFPGRFDVANYIDHVIVVCRVAGVGYGFVDQYGAHLIDASVFDEWESLWCDSGSFDMGYGLMLVGVRRDLNTYSVDSVTEDIMVSYDEVFVSVEDDSSFFRTGFVDFEQVPSTFVGTFDMTSDRCYYDLRNFLYDSAMFIGGACGAYAFFCSS